MDSSFIEPYLFNPEDISEESYIEFLMDQFEHCEKNMSNTLEVKPSRIIGAGLGVFAKREIIEGEILGRYYGTYTSCEEQRSDIEELYCFEVNGLKIYPDENCILRYINDNVKLNSKGRMVGRHNLVHNSLFEVVEDYVFVVASEDISPGEELYISYGRAYWM